jgi:hypothetical protein
MKDKLIKILEAALNNSKLVLSGEVIAENINFLDECISNVKYKNTRVSMFNRRIKFNTIGKYSKAKRIKFNVDNLIIEIRPDEKFSTIPSASPTTIEGDRASNLEFILNSMLGDDVFNFKKTKITLDASLDKYSKSYILKYNDFEYPIEESDVDKLYETYKSNLEKFREKKPNEDLNKIMRQLGIDE